MDEYFKNGTQVLRLNWYSVVTVKICNRMVR